MNRRLFILAALALGGCATMAEPPKVTPSPKAYGELEPLYSAQAGREALTIQVGSNGCTAKADFAFFVEHQGEAVTLAFGRKRVDPCRSALSFTWEELGLAPRASVVLLNPLTAWTGPGAL
jgi:hypothetical protein